MSTVGTVEGKKAIGKDESGITMNIWTMISCIVGS